MRFAAHSEHLLGTGSQLPEDDRGGGRDCHHKHLSSSGQEGFGRPRADSTRSVWKLVCGVGSTVSQFLDETIEAMKLDPQERINESIAEVPVPHFREMMVDVMNRNQIIDVLVPGENEQLGEVPVSVSQDVCQDGGRQRFVEQTSVQSAREQIQDVPVPQRQEQLVEVPASLSYEVFQDSSTACP